MGTSEDRLRGRDLTLAYEERIVAEAMNVTIPDGSLTIIVGPNACGKSTLLRALARLLTPRAGVVLLDGEPISSLGTKEVARRLGFLPQAPLAPEGVTVTDLVARGRYPHQRVLRQWSAEDEAAVRSAMQSTGVADLADRQLEELSGGQRQRVWIAMALAQETSILLLDEPTTFLDISHQIEVLDLCVDLQRAGRTIVAVLHDLNLAARYATRLIAIREGRIVAEGVPSTVVTAEVVEHIFDLPCRIIVDPETGSPLVVPAARRATTVSHDR